MIPSREGKASKKRHLCEFKVQVTIGLGPEPCVRLDLEVLKEWQRVSRNDMDRSWRERIARLERDPNETFIPN